MHMTDPWVECELLTQTRQQLYVLRVVETGAIIPVRLSNPPDPSKVCLVCVMKPVPCRAKLEPFLKDEPCEVEIDWPADVVYPARTLYRPRKRKNVST